MTEITVHSPYQIFAEPTLPMEWEEVFQKKMSSIPNSYRRLREEAWRLVNEFELPNRKDESWRWMEYKSLPFAGLNTTPQKPISLQLHLISEEDEETNLSWSDLPEGVVIGSLSAILSHDPELVERCLSHSKAASDGKFAALAIATAQDGLFIYIPKNVALDKVLSIKVNLDLDSNIVWSHSLICLDTNAQASVEINWTNQMGNQDGLHNGVVEVVLGEAAKLHLDERQHFDSRSWNISHSIATLQKDAHLDWNVAVLGAKSSKNFVKVDLFGKGASAEIRGLMFPDRDEVVNLDTRQNHWDESTTSDLLFKAVAANEGRSIWHGMIYVDPKAQKTDAYQTNRNLILDDSADVKSIPGLEIHADDVKCSHGATVGKIDAAELFYLEARGIPEREAQKLIVEGFFNQVLHSYKLESTRESLRELLVEKMERL